MAEQKDLERLEPQIKQNKEKQDKTKKEFNAVDSEKEKLSALERKSDYASQVSPFLFLPVPVMQGRWMARSPSIWLMFRHVPRRVVEHSLTKTIGPCRA